MKRWGAAAFVFLAILLFSCAPEPAWPDTTPLRASLPLDFGTVEFDCEEKYKPFFDFSEAFFSNESEPIWWNLTEEWEYVLVPGVSWEDLPAEVHAAADAVIQWHRETKDQPVELLTAHKSSYRGMYSICEFNQLKIVFALAHEEDELMEAYVHLAQVLWNNGTFIMDELCCRNVWLWLNDEPSLTEEEKRAMLLRYPLRREAGVGRFRDYLSEWVKRWEGMTDAKMRKFTEKEPLPNKLDYLEDAYRLVALASKDFPLNEEDKQFVRGTIVFGPMSHVEFHEEPWIPRFAMD